MLRLGVDVGGTKIAVGLFSDEGLIISKKYMVTEVVSFPEFLCDVCSAVCEEAGISISEVEGLGIGIPGSVSEDGRRVLKAPNIKILSPDLVERTEALTGLKVRMVQDSRAAAYGEYLFGGGKGASLVVCVTVGTGIGTGIVVDGKMYNGGIGYAGETGHVPVSQSNRTCGCGKRGCLETLSAGKGLDMTARELLGEGNDARQLFDAASSGNAAALEAIIIARTELARMLTAIVNVLSPDVLLISGGMSLQRELYIDPIMEFVREHSYSAERSTRVEIASLGELSGLYGAAFV